MTKSATYCTLISVLIFIGVLPFAEKVWAQNWKHDSTQLISHETRQVGLIVGSSLGGTVVSEGEAYKPLLLMLYATFNLKKQAHKKSKFLVVTEPQINFVIQNKSVIHFETGINIGLQYRYSLGQGNWFFTHVSTGPHYISLHSQRQAGGFIFSDNFASGFSFQVVERLRTGFQYRFRHLSNASLKRPNKGINNHLVLFELVLEW